jgi:subtilisin-like proprotein convertase family protein
VVHEWGHGYDQNDGGGYDNTSEAYGDLVAMLATRESCFFRGFFADGGVCSGYGDTCLSCTGFRDFDYEARVSSTPATPQGFVASYCGTEGTGPCGGEVHCEAYPIGEAMYDLAVRDLPAAGMDLDSAWQLVERLWYSTRQGSSGSIYTCALPASDSCAVGSWYQRMREADDDDADLSNGTPHAAELFAAFDRHNLACGEADAPENQSTSSCPALDAPVLTVAANEDGTTLSWPAVAGASQYLVLRGELGCDRQQVPLAVLDSAATSYLDAVSDPGLPRDYRIQAIGVNPTCRSAVSDCRTTPAGPRLQLNGHRLVEDATLSNGNGLPDPGETVQLPVTLFNGGRADAFDVSARLRMADPSLGRVLVPLASTPDLAVGAAAESDAPHFEVTLFESSASCGIPVVLDVEMRAGATGPRTSRFQIPLGNRERDFVDTDTVSIPRLTMEPVISTLQVLEDRPIAELDVTVDIAHPDSSELVVELTSPGGTTVRLHDRTGGTAGLYTRYDLDAQPDGPGTMDDFVGESILGTWTLSVEDKVYGAFGFGSIQGFTLHVVAEGAFDCDPVACPEPAPSESPQGLRVERALDAGDGSVSLTLNWTGVVGAAGYHVLQAPAAAFDAGVELAGRTAGPTSLTLNDVDATLPPLTFFQVRATNSCHQESP